MVTAADIAKMTGFSRSSVSSVLSGTALQRRISVKTIRTVLAAAEEVGYKPNVLASSLRKGKTGMVGILIPSPSDSIYAGLVGQLNTLLANAGYFSTFAFWDTVDEQGCAAESILGRQPEGIITVEPKHIPERIPFPVITFIVNDSRFDNVTFDRLGIIRDTISYLTSLGHTRIANPAISDNHLGGKDYNDVSAYFRQTFSARSLSQAWFTDIASRNIKGVLLAEKISDWIISFPERERPTALILYTDNLAAQVMLELNKRGIGIPDDISVIGCDNVSFANLLSPALTTFGDDPRKTMAAVLGNRLLFRMTHHDAPVERIFVKRKLYIRASCGKPKC